jgi:hypothetical protein
MEQVVLTDIFTFLSHSSKFQDNIIVQPSLTNKQRKENNGHETDFLIVRFEILMAPSMKKSSASSSETSVSIYQTTCCYTPEDSHLLILWIYVTMGDSRQYYGRNLRYSSHKPTWSFGSCLYSNFQVIYHLKTTLQPLAKCLVTYRQ